MTISIAVASSSQKKLLNGGKMTDEATLQQSAEMRCGCSPRG